MMMASSTQTQLISEVAGEVMTIISQWAFLFMCLQYFACGLYFSQEGGCCLLWAVFFPLQVYNQARIINQLPKCLVVD